MMRNINDVISFYVNGSQGGCGGSYRLFRLLVAKTDNWRKCIMTEQLTPMMKLNMSIKDRVKTVYFSSGWGLL